MRKETIILENIVFVIHFYSEEDNLILEAKMKGRHLDGTYSAIKHKPHNPKGEYHLHVFDRENEIFAINKSGFPHDGYHGVTIPKRAFDALQRQYPDWKWPDNRILESHSNVGFFERNSNTRNYLRPVLVESYKLEFTPNNWTQSFKGFFHGYAEVPFQTANAWINCTKAIVEDIDGHLQLVPIEKISFIDI